jgi:NADH-quinone oxidoreductase subunit J
MGPGAIVFYALAAVAVASAVMVVTRRSPVHSAMFLVLSFLCMAGIFIVLEAEFLAAVQVLVYAGGIMVLFLFVIMLVNLGTPLGPVRSWQAAAGVVVVTGLVLVLLSSFMSWRPEAPDEVPAFREGGGNLQAVGMSLYQDYLLPFEVASVLLLVAMIGAVVLALRREGPGSDS